MMMRLYYKFNIEFCGERILKIGVRLSDVMGKSIAVHF